MNFKENLNQESPVQVMLDKNSEKERYAVS